MLSDLSTIGTESTKRKTVPLVTEEPCPGYPVGGPLIHINPEVLECDDFSLEPKVQLEWKQNSIGGTKEKDTRIGLVDLQTRNRHEVNLETSYRGGVKPGVRRSVSDASDGEEPRRAWDACTFPVRDGGACADARSRQVWPAVARAVRRPLSLAAPCSGSSETASQEGAVLLVPRGAVSAPEGTRELVPGTVGAGPMAGDTGRLPLNQAPGLGQ
ncbi:hypothetical protein NDU88_001564 [Pleurodeles waltl]|uniref:Uncharacterized protein n=1 Tax=Pleurodeles waltl TaxID=8319 RepID=A0AAV7RD01_PLEWA|nr:hypothetical protein NDU88_001564 [Pleurodeles waltl]